MRWNQDWDCGSSPGEVPCIQVSLPPAPDSQAPHPLPEGDAGCQVSGRKHMTHGKAAVASFLPGCLALQVPNLLLSKGKGRGRQGTGEDPGEQRWALSVGGGVVG